MKNLPINSDKKFKYSITFQSWDEESLEVGQTDNHGFIEKDEIDTIGEILHKANSDYGIYMPVSFGTWESTEPIEDKDYFEKGIKKYFGLHILNEDGTKITEQENDFITFLLSDGRFEIDKFREYAVGGLVAGAIAVGIGGLIAYYYFKGKKKASNKNNAKHVEHNDIKYPIKDAWRREHKLHNKAEDYEVPKRKRKRVSYAEGGMLEGISQEDYFLVVQNWVYFTFNYPSTFLTSLSEFHRDKFSIIYEKNGADAVIPAFWKSINDETKYDIAIWVKNNYVNRKSEKEKIQSISDKDYYDIVVNWNMFCQNPPMNFIEDTFGDMAEHFESKWVRYYSKSAIGSVNRFFVELSGDRQELLTNWVYKNFKPMNFAGGGSLDLSMREKVEMYSYLDDNNWTLESFMARFNKDEEEADDIIMSWAKSRGYDKKSKGGETNINKDAMKNSKDIKIRIDSVISYLSDFKYDTGYVGKSKRKVYHLDNMVLNPENFYTEMRRIIGTSSDPDDWNITENGILENDVLMADEMMEATSTQIRKWKKGEMNLFSEDFQIRVTLINADNTIDNIKEVLKIENYTRFNEGGHTTLNKNIMKRTNQFADGGEAGKWVNYDKNHLINTETGMIVSKGTNLKDIKPKDIKGFEKLGMGRYADGFSKWHDKYKFNVGDRVSVTHGKNKGIKGVIHSMESDFTGITIKTDNGHTLYGFDDADLDKFADGGRVTTNEDVLKSFLTSTKEVKANNLSTHFNEHDNTLLLRNYGTIIASRRVNNNQNDYDNLNYCFVTKTKYSVTTSKIVNQLKALATKMGYTISDACSFAKGGILGEDARLEYIYDAFASLELRDKLKEALGLKSEYEELGDNYVISFAYTDYGGDFLDKVAIQYFQEYYPENTLVEPTGWNGQNAYVFGEPAKEWIETTQDYPLGFEDIEDFYYEKENEQEAEDFNYFLDEITDDYNFDREEAFDWLMENKSGHYQMTTQGLDFSFEDLTDELVVEGIIEPKEEDEYAKGGTTKNKKLGAEKKSKIEITEDKEKGTKYAKRTLVKENNKGEKITYELSVGIHTNPKEKPNRYADGFFEIDATDEDDNEYYYAEGGLWIKNGKIYDYDGVYELSEKLRPLMSALNLNTKDVYADGGGVESKIYMLLYDFVDEKMIEGDSVAESMINEKGYSLTYDELYDYVDEKMIEGDSDAKNLLNRINSFKNGGEAGGVESKIYMLLYDFVDEKMIEGDSVAESMINEKGYSLTYDELYDYVDEKMIEGDSDAKNLLNRINSLFAKGGKAGEIIYLKNPYNENGSFIEGRAKDNISEIMRNVSFRKFGNEFRKHINPNFSQENNIERVNTGISWSELASYIIGDGDYSVEESQYENFIKAFNTSYGEEYAGGGEVEDWMEEALESLIEETGFDDLEITMVSDNGNEFYCTDGDAEYRVFKTEDDAEEKAIEVVREDLEESPENFNQDWLMYYVDGRDFFEEQLNEMNDSYIQDIESESDKKYANSLIAQLVENGLLDEEDAESDSAEELAEDLKYDYMLLLTEQQLDEGNNGLDYFISNFGEKETMKMVIDNNLIDIDLASKDAVNVDGIGHFLSSYDGETLYLKDDCVAYRVN